jgi:penicillin-binding protein 2
MGALAKDCRVYFAHYAGAVGPKPLVLSALRYGFGMKSGIEVSESAGTLPTLGVIGQDGSSHQRGAADARLMAMGQGDFTATPLQVARAMAAIANQGRLLNVRLVEAPVNEQGTAAIPIEPAENAFKLIREALAQAVTSEESATHGSLSIEGINVAGLTATGIVAGDQSDHAWCAGYLPADSPQYAFAIAIEHGGKGYRAAAPVVRRFLSRLWQLGCFEPGLVDTRGL